MIIIMNLSPKNSKVAYDELTSSPESKILDFPKVQLTMLSYGHGVFYFHYDKSVWNRIFLKDADAIWHASRSLEKWLADLNVYTRFSITCDPSYEVALLTDRDVMIWNPLPALRWGGGKTSGAGAGNKW